MASLTSPLAKKFVLDVIAYTPEVDGSGNRIPRVTFSRSCYRGAVSLKQKLIDDTWVSFDEGKTWMGIEEAKALPERPTVMEEKFSSDPIVLDQSELDAFKFYYNQLDELSDYGLSAFSEIEELILT